MARINISKELQAKYPDKTRDEIRFIVSGVLQKVNRTVGGECFRIVVRKFGTIATRKNKKRGTKAGRKRAKARNKKASTKRAKEHFINSNFW